MSWHLGHHPPGHFDEREALRWGARALALGILIGLAFVLHGMFRDASKGPSLQRIKLLSPAATPPPPPPPQEEQPQPDQKVKEEISAIDQQFATPGAKGEAGSLGVDSEGDAGSDAFGLAAKPGGRELTTYPEGSGYGLATKGGDGGTAVVLEKLNANFGRQYEARLGSRLQALLARREDLRHRAYRTTAIIWMNERGVITKAQIPDMGRDADWTEKLAGALNGLDTGEAPPQGYRFPIRILVTSKMDARP